MVTLMKPFPSKLFLWQQKGKKDAHHTPKNDRNLRPIEGPDFYHFFVRHQLFLATLPFFMPYCKVPHAYDATPNPLLILPKQTSAY